MTGNTLASGYALLRDPRLNKGSAFSETERAENGLEGLLPPTPSSLEHQIARIHLELANLEVDLHKYLLLSDLQARNETLFYAVLMSDLATFMPLVYTPTVGEACQKFDHIFRAARGVYLPITAQGRLKELLAHWPQDDVRFIVVTDGERILGLGDLGVGGMGIPIGKLALYTACAGIPPQLCLPITLDVGTNNHQLLDDPLYLGLRQERVSDIRYMDFIEEFVHAVQEQFPKACLQWEDFANRNAVPILAKYRDAICTYNDDIQGTAAIALAGIYAALRITGGKLTEQSFLFLGAGSAATGIAELISQAMAIEGLELADARKRNILYDVNGLLTTSRTDLGDFQRPFALEHGRDVRGCREDLPAQCHHWGEHRPKAVQPAGHRGNVRGQRAADHFSLLKPDLAFGVHRRGSLPLVEGQGCVRQRQSVSACGAGWPAFRARPGQQRLHLSGDGHGHLRH